MKKMKKWFFPLLLVFAVAVGAIGGAWGYYQNSSDVQNRMTTKGSSVVLKEVFNPSDLWVPGESKQKEVSFGNVGSNDQVIRFKVVEKWYNNNGTPNILDDDIEWSYTGTYNPTPSVIHWTESVADDWWYNTDDGYYYYKKVLKSNTDTPLVIDSVSFSDEISNAGPGAADDFSNKRYSLTVQMETLNVDSSETSAGWDMTFTDAEDTLSWSAAS